MFFPCYFFKLSVTYVLSLHTYFQQFANRSLNPFALIILIPTQVANYFFIMTFVTRGVLIRINFVFLVPLLCGKIKLDNFNYIPAPLFSCDHFIPGCSTLDNG